MHNSYRIIRLKFVTLDGVSIAGRDGIYTVSTSSYRIANYALCIMHYALNSIRMALPRPLREGVGGGLTKSLSSVCRKAIKIK